MLYRLSKHYIKFVGEDNYKEGEIKSSTSFKTLDNDFYSTLLTVVKEKIIEDLLEKDYNANDVSITLNACGELGRIDVEFISSKPNKYCKLGNNDIDLFVINKLNLYNITLSFYVETSTDYGKTYQKLLLKA